MKHRITLLACSSSTPMDELYQKPYPKNKKSSILQRAFSFKKEKKKEKKKESRQTLSSYVLSLFLNQTKINFHISTFSPQLNIH